MSCSVVLDLCTGSRRRSPRSNGASASSAAASTCAVVDAARRAVPCANFAAYSPARLPKTSRSDSELPPRRLAPLMPGRALAGGEQARARVDICVSPSTRTPPMM